MKKKIAIVFGITSNYVFALANVLIGMRKHGIFWDDIIVFHDNIESEEQAKLNRILPCIFRNLPMEKFVGDVNQESINAYSYLCMARFECFDMLDDYEYVIWHDVDILIQKDFSELLQSAEESGLALTFDCQFCVEQNFWNADIEGYNLLKPLYNSGIMVLRDVLSHYEEMTEYCYAKFGQNSKKLRYLDQAILNMLIQDFNIKVGYISLEKYCCHPSKKNYRDASIIHAYGNQKFWNSDSRKIQFPEWIENNHVWESLELENDNIVLPIASNTIVSCILYLSSDTVLDYDALKSILNQEEKNIDINVIIEYCAEQKSIYKGIVENCEDRRIKVICNSEYKGRDISFLEILRSAVGKYVVFFDGKTYSMPNRFIKEVEYLETKPELIAVGSSILISGQKEIMPYEHKRIKAMLLFKPTLLDRTIMFRRQKLLSFIETVENSEDFTFWGCLLKENIVENIEEVLVVDGFESANNPENVFIRPDEKEIDTVRKNIKNIYDINLSYDEVILLMCPEIIDRCYNSASFRKKRSEVVDVILKVNEDEKMCDQASLEESLGIESRSSMITELSREDLTKRIIRNIVKREVVLWGTGKRCQNYITKYPDFPISFCIDNDETKRNKRVEDIKIKHVADIHNWKQYFIIVTPVKGEEIGKQLESYGLKYAEDFAWGTDVF